MEVDGELHPLLDFVFSFLVQESGIVWLEVWLGMDPLISREDEFGGSVKLPDIFLLPVYYKPKWNDCNSDEKHKNGHAIIGGGLTA